MFSKTMCWKGGRAARGQVFTYVVPRACMQYVCTASSGLANLGNEAGPPDAKRGHRSCYPPDGCGCHGQD